MKNKNIFTILLRLLQVKHTKDYSSRLYEENPHKHNMYGLSSMLSEYKVRNRGLKINDTDTLLKFSTPFVAHLNTGLAVVSELTMSSISYFGDDGKHISTSFQDFIDKWSGIVLITERDDNSIEPNYKINKQKEYIKKLEYIFLIGGVITLIIFGFLYNKIFLDLGAMFSISINTIGIYIAYLLIISSFRIKNNRADKICHSIKNGDCDSILNSQGAKILGLYGWSEIGMSYFTSNILLILLFPHLITYMIYINICALPYSIWSVWYQKTKVQKWCPLCLIVQVILWMLFFNNLLFYSFQTTHLTFIDMITTGYIYLIPFLIINLISQKVLSQIENRDLKYSINRLKSEDGVFSHILHLQPQFSVNKSASDILFGNLESKVLITILINPHCRACAYTHQKVIKLLDKKENSFCIQYLISAMSETLKSPARVLIGAYINNTNDKALDIYDKWFEWGRYNIDDFVKKYNIDAKSQKIDDELHKHILWMEKNDLPSAPLTLINGYELPSFYGIKDLEHYKTTTND